MTPQSRKTLAWGIAFLSAVLIAAFLVVSLTLPSPVDESGDIYFIVPAGTGMLAFAGVGALIASRTVNPIGWIFLAIAALLGATFVAQSYTEYAVPHGAPLASIAAWLANWLLVGTLALPVAVFFLYPTGTPASGRWRWVWRVYLVALAVNAAGWAVLPFESEFGGVTVRNPVALEPIEGAIGVVLAVAGFTLVASAFLSFASLIVRFRRAGDEERQQIRWLAVVGVVAAIAFALGLVAGIISDQTHSRALELFGSVMLVILVAAVALGIPITAGIAILRYRLYDLDIVVKKTVVFAIVASTLTVLYLAVLALATLGNVSRILVGVVLLAVTFNPVRRTARTIADRVVYGKRATPYEVLTSFSGRVGETYSANDVLPRMARVLAEGVGAESATVWLRVGGELRPEASWPTDVSPRPRPLRGDEPLAIDEGGHAIEVRDQGELLGALSLVMPPSEPMNPAKEALVRDLASQAGLVLRNARLIEELRASRQRIVAAQDARAKQLERNIHDGAQQQLVALTVKLRLLGQLASRDPARTAEMASELQTEATEALEDLRDLARGIYPPLLADKGLPVALEGHARKVHVPVTVEADGLGRYPQEVEAAVYFCCLEALQNIVKYAEASHVSVNLSIEADQLNFSVTDDGKGFDPASIPQGSGLQGMADRMEALGGTLEVRSEPGTGTTVTGRIPAGAMEPIR
jgi:signal transduction histidine kinase